ncbi:MAG: ABC transporter ATP-binding protein [Bacteroidetes bacterium]|nr:ABC transporter ATP-binding protein [Bacteroidota bacterium]
MNNNSEKELYKDLVVAIEVKNLTKTYINGTEMLTVLNSVNFKLMKGSSVVIMGKSGCGKSTFLHMVGGLDSADSGTVFAAGQQIDSLNSDKLTQFRKNHIGFIFQMHYLLEDFTALENLMVTAMIHGNKKKESKDSALALMNDVGLLSKINNYPGQLSGGERQRVAIARALINDPDIILADEPTGNLDEENSRVIEDLLFGLVKKYQKSLVLVTHDSYISNLADETLILQKGVFRGDM